MPKPRGADDEWRILARITVDPIISRSVTRLPYQQYMHFDSPTTGVCFLSSHHYSIGACSSHPLPLIAIHQPRRTSGGEL